MKKIKNGYVFNNVNIVKTNNSVAIYNRKNNSGYTVINVDRNTVNFTVFSDDVLSSHSSIVITDYDSNNWYDNEGLFNISISSPFGEHPFNPNVTFDNSIHCNGYTLDNVIINIIKFSRHNELNVFIQDINLKYHTDIDTFLFGETYAILNSNIQEIIEKISPSKFRQVWNDSVPTFIQTTNVVNDLRYTNGNRNILLPKNVIKSIYSHPICQEYGINMIQFDNNEYTPMLFGYIGAMSNIMYTLDGVYTTDYYDDYMLDEYLSDNMPSIGLYYNESGTCYRLSMWSNEYNPDFIYDNNYNWVNSESAYFHTDCTWYDENTDEYRLLSDSDDMAYIHPYHYDGDLYAPEKFERATEFQYGLEIEVEFSSYTNVSDITTEIVENYSEDERNFHLEEDGSLDDKSFEMVTCPIVYDGQLPEWLKNSLNTINKNEPKFWNCGGHVHIDRDSFQNDDSIKLFTYLVNHFETFIFNISGRDGYSRYAQFQDVENIDSLDDIRIDENNGINGKYYNRYVVVNREKDCTVEFRIFKGTTNVKTINKRLQLLKHMVEYCNDFINQYEVYDMELIKAITWLEFSGISVNDTLEF